MVRLISARKEFPPVLSEGISQYRLPYNSLKTHNNVCFRTNGSDTRNGDADSLQLEFSLRLSRRPELYIKILIFFRLSYGAYQKPRYQQSPCREAHHRAGYLTQLRAEKVTGVSIGTD